MMEKMDFRRRCYEILHVPVGTFGKVTNGLIALLIALSIAVIPFHFIPQLKWFLPYLAIFEWFTVIVFTVEYGLRVWSAQKPIRHLYSWDSVIDLIAIIPFYLQLFGVLENAYLFLALRILRILKLGKSYSFERSFEAGLIQDQHGEFRALARERVEYVIQKHPLVFLLMLIPSLLFLSLGLLLLVGFRAAPVASVLAIVCFMFTFLYFFKAWLDFHYDVIYVTNHRLIIQNRQLFGSRLNDLVYEAITNVRPDNTGLLRYLFKFGDIRIQTAAIDGDRLFTNISHPHAAATQIYKNRQRILEKDNAVQHKENK